MKRILKSLSSAGFFVLSVLSPTHAQDRWALCRPIEAMAYQTRVHIKCEFPVAPGIIYLAASTAADSRFATRVVNLGAVAQVTQKTLAVLFDPSDTTGAAYGCSITDCRAIRAIGLTEAASPIPATPSVTPRSRAECVADCDESSRRTCTQVGKGAVVQSCLNALNQVCTQNCPP